MSSPETPLGRPQRLGGQGLANVFGRSAGLRGGLAPLTPSAAPAESSDTTEDEQAPTAAEVTVLRPEPTAPAKKTPRSAAGKPGKADPPRTVKPVDEPRSEASGAQQTVVVYTTPALRERIQKAKDIWRLSHTDLALRAISATHNQLGDLLGGAAPPEPEDSLFSSTPARRRRLRPEGSVQVFIRPIADDLAIIDGLVAKYRAGSRSELVETAITAFLDQNGA